jgi:hypothetical protein
MSDLPISSYACFYLALSKPRRKIFQYLYWYQKKYPNSFPKMEKIAKYAKISIRAVQKFFSLLEKEKRKHFYLKVEARFNRFGGNTSNRYVLNNNFKMGLDWLNIHGFLNSPVHKTNFIISSMQKEEEVRPPPPSRFTPLSKDSSRTDLQTLGSGVWINPAVKELRGLDMWAKIYASRYASEYEIQEALEACRFQEKKRKIPNTSSYFMGVLRNKMDKKKLARKNG